MRNLKRIGIFLTVFTPVFIFLCLKEPGSLLQFRTSDSNYHWWTFCDAPRDGLENLRASGSGVIHEKALVKSLLAVPAPHEKTYVVNLTIEGQRYANGRPFRWFNWQHVNDRVEEPYRKVKNIYRFKDNLKWFLRRKFYERPQTARLETEEEMIHRLGYQFASFFVVRRQLYPPQVVDRLIEFVSKLPEDAWVHFHCDGGNSRTTTMMILYDIMKNGKLVPLEAIVERQHGLGGVNIFDTEPNIGGTWKHRNLIDRRKMVENFYRYVNDPQGYGHIKWSEWLEKQAELEED